MQLSQICAYTQQLPSSPVPVHQSSTLWCLLSLVLQHINVNNPQTSININKYPKQCNHYPSTLVHAVVPNVRMGPAVAVIAGTSTPIINTAVQAPFSKHSITNDKHAPLCVPLSPSPFTPCPWLYPWPKLLLSHHQCCCIIVSLTLHSFITYKAILTCNDLTNSPLSPSLTHTHIMWLLVPISCLLHTPFIYPNPLTHWWAHVNSSFTFVSVTRQKLFKL